MRDLPSSVPSAASSPRRAFSGKVETGFPSENAITQKAGAYSVSRETEYAPVLRAIPRSRFITPKPLFVSLESWAIAITGEFSRRDEQPETPMGPRDPRPDQMLRPAGRRRPRPHGAGRRVLCAARSQRRRQDDDAAHGRRAAASPMPARSRSSASTRSPIRWPPSGSWPGSPTSR